MRQLGFPYSGFSGNRVAITMPNWTYDGTIADDVLSGNARLTTGQPIFWTFSVRRSTAEQRQ